MTTVIHLIPGDRIIGGTATFTAQCPHPIYPRMQLLVWVDDDGTIRLDMAAPGDDVGPVEAWATVAEHERRLHQALPTHQAPASANGRRR